MPTFKQIDDLTRFTVKAKNIFKQKWLQAQRLAPVTFVCPNVDENGLEMQKCVKENVSFLLNKEIEKLASNNSAEHINTPYLVFLSKNSFDIHVWPSIKKIEDLKDTLNHHSSKPTLIYYPAIINYKDKDSSVYDWHQVVMIVPVNNPKEAYFTAVSARSYCAAVCYQIDTNYQQVEQSEQELVQTIVTSMFASSSFSSYPCLLKGHLVKNTQYLKTFFSECGIKFFEPELAPLLEQYEAYMQKINLEKAIPKPSSVGSASPSATARIGL